MIQFLKDITGVTARADAQERARAKAQHAARLAQARKVGEFQVVQEDRKLFHYQLFLTPSTLDGSWFYLGSYGHICSRANAHSFSSLEEAKAAGAAAGAQCRERIAGEMERQQQFRNIYAPPEFLAKSVNAFKSSEDLLIEVAQAVSQRYQR
ncbi:hypothetical protein Ccr2_gp259 [Caulobacter phage Ccr2]|nr:hypothetical protein Ccr10_gp260 [Caulobacter phage Ccr10]ARB14135.1 hypothetical protein Ccr2_gp259 [Caulobacter phage Ccr2]ARB14829.1 hypothetical protein Ccr29_gp273 [Caulobacter phage Ccr29]